MDAHRAREAAEVALDQVIAGRPARRIGALFLTRDQDDARLQEDAEAVGRDPGDIEHDLDRPIGFEDVDQRQAFARHHVPAVRTTAGEIFEQAPDLLAEVADVSGNEQTGHGASVE